MVNCGMICANNGRQVIFALIIFTYIYRQTICYSAHLVASNRTEWCVLVCMLDMDMAKPKRWTKSTKTNQRSNGERGSDQEKEENIL